MIDNMPETNSNLLFDEADLAKSRRDELNKRLDHPIIISFQEFCDEHGKVIDKSPIYIIVHEDEIDRDPEIDEETRRKLFKELDFIKKNFTWKKAGPYKLVAIKLEEMNRPVIVCGAYDAVCVGQQHDLLIKAGYDAYISKEGTLPFKLSDG